MVRVGKIRHTNWNRVRRLTRTATLTLLSYEQTAGETELLKLCTNWTATIGPDNDTSRVTVRIEDGQAVQSIFAACVNTTPPDDGMMIEGELARFRIDSYGIARTYRVLEGGVQPPFARTREWRVSGEEIRDTA